MKRRAYLASLGVAATSLATASAAETPANESGPAYRGNKRVVYDHPDLELRPRQERVRLGETVAFEVTSTGDSRVSLGCNNPWALQRRSGGRWRHVTWTGDRYYQLCATLLPPGESRVERVTLSESGLDGYPDEYSADLRPGRYRFLLLGPSPYPAVEFDVLDAG